MTQPTATVGRPRRRLALAAAAIGVAAVIATLVWVANRGDELATLRGHKGPVRSLAVAVDEGLLVSAGDDGQVRLWDLRTNRVAGSFTPHGPKSPRVGARAGEVVTVGTDRRLGVWSLPGGNRLKEIDLAELPEVVSANSDRVAVGFANGQIKVWTGSVSDPRILSGHTKAVRSLCFLPNGLRMLSAGSDGVIRIWDPSAGRAVVQLPVGHHAVHSLAVSPDSTRLVAAVAGTGLRSWNLPTLEELPPYGDDAGMAWCVAYSPDGSRIASGHEDGRVQLWDVTSGRVQRIYSGHTGVVLAAAFAPDGRSFFTAAGDGTIKRWPVP